MAAPKGNKYWEFRNKHGRDYKYQPEELWNEFIEYCKWVEDNPLWESVLVSKGIKIQTDEGVKEVYSTPMPKMRAMTLRAFQVFADINHSTWENYKKNKDFIAITTRIENIVYSQKFEGSAAGLLNPNIIARDLGLSEKHEHSGEIKNTQEITLTDKQVDKIINGLKPKS